jgi:SpoVK/Ycf46/Vps4 family AAA+-type ATPase
MIERINAIWETDSVSRYRVLYGPGIQDHFLDDDLNPIDFEHALLRVLKQAGYQRVVYISPQKPLYFLDLASKKLAMSSKTADPTYAVKKTSRFSGPLGDLLVLPEGRRERKPVLADDEEDLEPYKRMTDAFALQRLDHLMEQTNGPLTAVVMLQAETFLQHQSDQRSLAARIGRWQTQSVNAVKGARGFSNNICLFVFSAFNETQLESLANRLPVPELRAILSEQAEKKDIYQIGYPGPDEINRLIEMVKTTGRRWPESQDKILLRGIVAEGGNLSLWTRRLMKVSNEEELSTKMRDWFTQYLPGNKSALTQLDELVGLENVKAHIKQNAALMQLMQASGNYQKPNMHMMFVGNPGTGKTTVARLVGEIYFGMNLLKRGHLVQAQASDLVGDVVGATAIKTNRLVNRALDGVLFIDEAYMLTEEARGGFGQEALDTLLLRMEDDRDRLVVIFAGYPDKMLPFRQSNPGLPRRIPEENIIRFEDFSPEALLKVLKTFMDEAGFTIEQSAQTRLHQIVVEMHRQRDEHFGNAGEMRNLHEAILRQWALRAIDDENGSSRVILPEDIPANYLAYIDRKSYEASSLDDIFAGLVGMQPVREALQGLSARIEYQQLVKEVAGSDKTAIVRPQHMAFLGNPGTGKTTVARRMGEYFASTGLLRKGHCVEVSRVNLVGEHVGETAIKTMQVVRKALDGVLFIDEAYALSQRGGHDFGREVIDTLIKVLEDYQDRLVVIFAGYSAEMHSFLQTNPGLASRVPLIIDFPDFLLDELVTILADMAEEEGYILPDEVKEKAKQALSKRKQDMTRSFGNGRTVRSLFEAMRVNLSKRLLGMDRDFLQQNPHLLYQFEVSDLSPRS